MSRPDQDTKSISVFANSIETVFRKLVRFLVGRVSLANLLEMLRHIYVEEAENNLKKVRPDKNVPLTKLALVTGIDTRTLSQIRKNIFEQKNKYTQLPLKELTPESAVVEAWVQKVQTSGDELSARIMTYEGPDSEFEKLFRATISSRGVTTQSLIERLVATNSVEINRDEKRLKLIVDQFSPYFSEDEPNAVNAALSAISNLVSTIDNNVGTPQENRLFQRQVWTFRLSPIQRLEFRREMSKFLQSVHQQAKDSIEKWEQDEFEDDLLTAGVGFYYFEDET
jgi:hypothetical protein